MLALVVANDGYSPILGIITSIPNMILWTDQADCGHPVPALFCPVNICLVMCVCTQSRSQIEEATITGRVLVIVAIVETVHLPSQAATTCRGIPSHCLSIEDSLGKRKPLRLIGWWIWEIILCSCHGSEGPVHLVIVSEVDSLIRRLEVIVWSCLKQHASGDERVPLCVIREIPIVDQCSKCFASLPPVDLLGYVRKRVGVGRKFSCSAVSKCRQRLSRTTLRHRASFELVALPGIPPVSFPL